MCRLKDISDENKIVRCEIYEKISEKIEFFAEKGDNFKISFNGFNLTAIDVIVKNKVAWTRELHQEFCDYLKVKLVRIESIETSEYDYYSVRRKYTYKDVNSEDNEIAIDSLQ